MCHQRLRSQESRATDSPHTYCAQTSVPQQRRCHSAEFSVWPTNCRYPCFGSERTDDDQGTRLLRASLRLSIHVYQLHQTVSQLVVSTPPASRFLYLTSDQPGVFTVNPTSVPFPAVKTTVRSAKACGVCSFLIFDLVLELLVQITFARSKRNRAKQTGFGVIILHLTSSASQPPAACFGVCILHCAALSVQLRLTSGRSDRSVGFGDPAVPKRKMNQNICMGNHSTPKLPQTAAIAKPAMRLITLDYYKGQLQKTRTRMCDP